MLYLINPNLVQLHAREYKLKPTTKPPTHAYNHIGISNPAGMLGILCNADRTYYTSTTNATPITNFDTPIDNLCPKCAVQLNRRIGQ